MILVRSNREYFFVTLVFFSLVSLVLYGYGVWHYQGSQYGYLIWNLVLAWLPLLLTIRLRQIFRYKLWSSWEGIFYSIVWLLLLPNSFYMISDFIHLQTVPASQVLYYVVTFTSFIFTAVILGYSSLFLIHLKLRKRFSARFAAGLIALLLLFCSAGVYIGRDLRWNSWNILTNPGGLLFDISDRLIHLSSYPGMLLTISSFMALLVCMYLVIWFGARTISRIAS